jgi:hypothetical protein
MKVSIFVLLTSVLLFTTCMGLKETQNKKFEFIQLDEKLNTIVRNYKNNYSKNSIIYVIFENNISNSCNTIYLQRISNISDLYFRPVSYYTKVDNVIVLICSPKNGFVDPVNYEKHFMNEIRLFLIDDMLMRSIVKNEFGCYDIEYVNIGTIDHSDIWKVKIGSKVQIETLKKDVPFLKNLINDDVDLDKYYRVIEGGVDERNL